MYHYLDISNATVFASTETELIHLANEYAISLARDCDFFQGIHTALITAPLSLESTDSLDNLSRHLHQIIGYLPIFCAIEYVNKAKLLVKLIQNSSSSEFSESMLRLKEILEGLQSELKNWLEQRS